MLFIWCVCVCVCVCVQECRRKAVSWLAFWFTHSQLCYTAQTHMARDAIAHSGLDPVTSTSNQEPGPQCHQANVWEAISPLLDTSMFASSQQTL